MKKQRVHTTSGLYSFLEASGVLENGTSEDIQSQKKLYWNKVKREHKKQKRKEHKSFEILLSQKEFDFVTKAAQGQNTSVTNFIKMSALRSDDAGLITPSIIGEFREALYLNYTAIEHCVEEKVFTETLGNDVLQKLSYIENQIAGLLGKRRLT